MQNLENENKPSKTKFYTIGVDCPPELESKIKLFCKITKQPASKFAALAMDNEMLYQLDQMDEDKRQTFNEMVAKLEKLQGKKK